MPNQTNFKSDVISNQDSRFVASRIINEETEELLFEIIPASFGYEAGDNIELHFYSVPGNTLYLSTVIRADEDDILKSHVVLYEDESYKNYIRIDFTRLFVKKNISLIPGDYKITINFFTDEIGDYDNRKLYVDRISNSRTEVQLAYFNPRDQIKVLENANELREFTLPSFSKPVAVGVAEKIFTSGILTQDDVSGITYNNILDNIEVPESDQTFQNSIALIRRIGENVEESLKNQIEAILPIIYEKLREKIVMEGDMRIQKDEFIEFINEIVDEETRKLQSLADPRILIK
jgi:hypothetical protein